MYSVPPRLGILASGKGSNFVAIADAIAQGQLEAEIAVLIYNNPDAPVKERCQERGVPSILLNHRQFATREALDERIAQTLAAYQVDLVVMAGWMRIVTNVLIDRFPRRILNIHPSLLPSFPGHRAVAQALEYGVKITGCTVHIVTLEVDRGPILAQAPVPVLPNDTVETLHQRIQQAEHQIYPPTIAAYLAQLTHHHSRVSS
ncbi:MAG: phosphoribosylglycinamide formyltransferase [Pseudanabaenaceae cyanobacterium SKYGB_i_bin29]|nr:phosphoribosylglycinamide formyltransferase [Pseudanabaenaceae cyanobacterium SKYG29]MDW8421997.1 phosphoribosylglycinamide formyltransferase [Pseudanabaenaceae cyanobacterium SKYGB_i_bin29]